MSPSRVATSPLGGSTMVPDLAETKRISAQPLRSDVGFDGDEIHIATRCEFADAEIAQRVRSFLTSRHFPAFRQLQVDVHNGAVCLQGKVHSFYEKQVALSSCQRVAGVIALIDQILVDLDENSPPALPR